MAGGKTNTQRLETLESQAASLSARLDVLYNMVERLVNQMEKCLTTAEGHGTKIIVIEQQVLLLAELRAAVTAIASLREELVAVRKDIEGLQSWKADQKKEREEAARRLWSFGPNVTGALITGAISLVGVLASLAIGYFLNRPK